MIGIGGAIGTGLFMGAGGRLHSAGPGLFVVYAICGLFVFFMLRALGELVLHRPPPAPSSPMLVNSSERRPHTSRAGCVLSTGPLPRSWT
ncbi:amino acid permease family protein [Mycobacteroides abscessus 1948]|uniref:Amino acid permease family protein n=1 Tax=Mycobacteroides abscessus 1948 TaxID=1299323 RepID=A0A829QRP2_9MYCO|nr:amino acid permease family protein [Mycobacteroides abscessus 1948]